MILQYFFCTAFKFNKNLWFVVPLIDSIHYSFKIIMFSISLGFVKNFIGAHNPNTGFTYAINIFFAKGTTLYFPSIMPAEQEIQTPGHESKAFI